MHEASLGDAVPRFLRIPDLAGFHKEKRLNSVPGPFLVN
jgi:hypothetical protein